MRKLDKKKVRSRRMSNKTLRELYSGMHFLCLLLAKEEKDIKQKKELMERANSFAKLSHLASKFN